MRKATNVFETTHTREVELDYLLYLPDDYDQDGRYPLILFLHGAGERTDDITSLYAQGLPTYLEAGNDLPFIVVAPQCYPDLRWEYFREPLIALLDQICTAYAVDTSRVYLTGLSMGGYGTWDLARLYPERFAAIAPICGGLSWEIDVMKAATALKSMPVWAFHGALDDVVLPEQTQVIVDALESVGGDVRFTLYPDKDHDSWTITYQNAELYDWFLAHSLTR